MRIVIVKPFGDYVEGPAELPDDVAQSLVDLGYAVEAPEASDEDAPVDETAKALEGITAKLEAKLVKHTEDLLAKAAKNSLKRPTVTIPAEPKDRLHGFKSMGDWYRALGKAALGDYNAQQKLQAFKVKAPTGQNVATDADGGHLVPDAWADKVFEKARDGLNLIDFTDQHTTSYNTLNIPTVNDTSRADGSRPLRHYLVGEGNDFTSSKIVFGNTQLTLYKIGILAYATDEMLSDNAYNLEQHVNKQIGDELRFALNNYIVNGTGSSQPTGILNFAATVTVDKEAAQTAATVNFPNLRKMWARLYFASRDKAIWLVNQAVMAELIGLTFPDASGTNPAYGLTYNAADEFPMRLFGRPVVECEACAALGNEGDVILANLGEIATATKRLEIAVSPHVNFVNGEVVYRAFIRFDSKSPWSAALTPFKGSQTVSPYITLEGRGT